MNLYLAAILAATPLADAATKPDAKSLYAARQRRRRLFTNEDGIKTLVGGTNLMKNKVQGTGPGAGPGTGPGTVTGPGTGARTGTGSSFGNRAKPKRSDLTDRDYTASLDSNTHGIVPSSVEFKYGDLIAANFELRNDYVSADVLESLNVTNIGEWEVCLYMRMQNNDDSILCADPSITGKSEVDQDTGLLTLDYTGSVEIPGSSTTSARLKEETYGTGFDLYVQDENGLKIIGPGTFYMAKTEGMKAAQMVTAEINHPLALYGHQKTKKAKYVSAAAELKSDAHVAELVASKGVGVGMVIGTTDALPSYFLSTDKEYYKMDESVEVTWDITDGHRRRLAANKKNDNKNVFGLGVGVKDGLDAVTLTGATPPGPPLESAAEDAHETLDMKNNKFGLGTNKDGLDVVTLTGATPPGPPQDGGDALDDTPAEPPQDDFDEMPLGMDSVDMEMESVDALGLEPEPTIDENDVTLYRLGIYMRMSNPQNGQLEPLLDYPFCKQPCTAPPDELMTGTWEFEIKDLPDPHPMTLGAYDVWVLNGEGDGIAGPVIWKLEE